MGKNHSIGFYTGSVKLEDWESLTQKEKHTALSKSWYMRWSFRNPANGKLERQKDYKGGVNYLKTKNERHKALIELRKLLSEFIKDGYSPYDNEDSINLGGEEIEKPKSVKEAFDLALEQIKLTVSLSTYLCFIKSKVLFWCLSLVLLLLLLA